jgi:ketosteroid isomerase-like protein
MSAENLELVRRIYDAWSLEESARAFIAEDVEYVNPSYAVEPGTRRGRKSLSVVRDTYEDFNVEVERFIDGSNSASRAAKRLCDELRIVVSGRVVQVAHGAVKIAVAHPFLHAPYARASDHRRCERVA